MSLRPVRWVLRVWVALQLVDLLWGTGSIDYGLSVVPSLHQWGLPLLVVAVAPSVQVGREVCVCYPWITVAGQARNGFRVHSRVQAAGLPGLPTSRATTPARALTPGALPKLPINPIDSGCRPSVAAGVHPGEGLGQVGSQQRWVLVAEVAVDAVDDDVADRRVAPPGVA